MVVGKVIPHVVSTRRAKERQEHRTDETDRNNKRRAIELNMFSFVAKNK